MPRILQHIFWPVREADPPKKHMRNVHKVVETTPVEIQVNTSHSTCIGVSEPRNTNAEDNSDWDEEPDISLVDTYDEEAARPDHLVVRVSVWRKQLMVPRIWC